MHLKGFSIRLDRFRCIVLVLMGKTSQFFPKNSQFLFSGNPGIHGILVLGAVFGGVGDIERCLGVIAR